MADYHLLIMPEVEGKADWKNYVGTGGYVLDNFEPGVRTSLKRNPNYWKEGRAHFDELELLVIADVNARQNAVASGEVDVISRCDLKTVHLLGRRPGVRVEEATGFLHYTAPMDTRAAPFNDNNVRMALKHAVDREQFLETILRGHGTLGNDQPIAPSVPFAADLEQRTYDPDKAKWYLKQAGLDSLDVDLSAADAAFAGAVDAAVLTKEQMAPAGINVNVVREPADGYWSNVWLVKPWCMCYWGGRPTCDWMFSQAYAEGANWNDTHWSHERFNMLLKAGRSELDDSKRAEIYREMQQIVRDEGGVVVLAFANYVYAMADKVQHGPDVAANWELDGGRYVERWWFA
jgi:peptide/nickel transport system substrate-binding protein